MDKKVLVYTSPTCKYCKIAKDWLNEHSIPFAEKNVVEDSAARTEMIEATKQLGLPVIKIDEEYFIGWGNNAEKIRETLGVKKDIPIE